MRPVRTARFLIGCSLAVLPAVCFAQGTGSGSTASGATLADSGSILMQTLGIFAEGAVPLEELAMTDKQRGAWNDEAQRYAERSSELRSRCHEEIRKANRDTIASKAAQCMRGDLMLEAAHRRKQREGFGAMKGVPAEIVQATTASIDAWLDAASTIVDGIDTGVFTTVDSLKVAKRNLHATYRAPMMEAFKRARIFQARALLFSISARVLESAGREARAEIEPIATCLVSAEAMLDPGHRAQDGGPTFADGLAELRRCVKLSK